MGYLNRVGSFLAWSSPGELGQFSPQNQHLVSLEISQILSALLSSEGPSNGALCKLLANTFFRDGSSDLSSPCPTANLDDLSGQLQSADGDDLSLDALPVDKHALVVEDVDDGGQLALERTVVYPGDATDLYELAVSLSRWRCTIVVVKYIDY